MSSQGFNDAVHEQTSIENDDTKDDVSNLTMANQDEISEKKVASDGNIDNVNNINDNLNSTPDIDSAPIPEKEVSKTELSQQQTDLPPIYSTFTDRQKKMIIFSASIASLFSPMSANIYLPALNTLSKDLSVSNSLINLTVTMYLVNIIYCSHLLMEAYPKLTAIVFGSLDISRHNAIHFCWIDGFVWKKAHLSSCLCSLHC